MKSSTLTLCVFILASVASGYFYGQVRKLELVKSSPIPDLPLGKKSWWVTNARGCVGRFNYQLVREHGVLAQDLNGTVNVERSIADTKTRNALQFSLRSYFNQIGQLSKAELTLKPSRENTFSVQVEGINPLTVHLRLDHAARTFFNKDFELPGPLLLLPFQDSFRLIFPEELERASASSGLFALSNNKLPALELVSTTSAPERCPTGALAAIDLTALTSTLPFPYLLNFGLPAGAQP
jgi:hypothetical protein